MLRRLTPDRRAFLAQIARYIVTGVAVTALGSLLYLAGVYFLSLHPQLATLLAYVLAAAAGYVAHSRFTFRGHGARRTPATTARFFVGSLVSYGLNAFWVWLLVDRLALPAWTPTLLWCSVTPAVVFVLNRTWVFR